MTNPVRVLNAEGYGNRILHDERVLESHPHRHSLRVKRIQMTRQFGVGCICRHASLIKLGCDKKEFEVTQDALPSDIHGFIR